MAFGAVGLGARLVFDVGRSIANMGRAGTAAKRMSAQFDRAKAAAVTMAKGVRTLAMAGGVLALALGGMTAKAAAFEQQMANVKAVAVTATGPQLEEMTRLAKELGATTAFSAVQAGEAMELLTRAGFDANEVLAATPAILDAAAAEGIGLAEASDLVAKTVRIMGLEATDAARAADVLALASAKSNTTMLALGEAFKFGGAQAKTMNMSLEETTAVFSKLADAGLKGSLAGTSFTNMMIKLSKPSGKATALMKKWGIQLTDSTGKLKPMGDIVNQFSAQLDKNTNVVEKSAMMQELFGIRGAKAFSALAEAGGDALNELTQQLMDAQGAARKMAETRLDTFKGQITLLKSAVEGFSIEIGSIMLPTLTQGVRKASKFIGDLAVGLGIVFAKPTKDAEILNKRMERWNKIGIVAQSVVKGMKEGIDILSAAWNRAMEIVSKITGAVGGNTDAIQQFAKVVTIVVGALAIFAPIALVVLGIFKLIAAAVSIVVGAVQLLIAAIGILTAGGLAPLLIAVTLVAGAFLMFRKEGESAFDTIKRVAKTVVKFFKGFVKGMKKGLTEAWEPLKDTAIPLWEAFEEVVMAVKATLKLFFKSSGTDAQTWGSILGQTIGVTVVGALKLLVMILGTVLESFLWVGEKAGWLASVVVQAFTWIWNKASSVASFISGVFAASWGILSAAANVAISAIQAGLSPLKTVITAVGQLVRGDFTGAWQTAKTPVMAVINAIKGGIDKVKNAVQYVINKIKRLIELAKKIPVIGGGGGGGAFGPLPVEPGPTPPVLSPTPTVTANVDISGGSSETIVHTHLILDGREIAVSIEKFKADRKFRSTAVSPGELRELVDLTAIA